MLTVDQARKCYDDFQKQGIWDDNEEVFVKNFRKWSLKNHPDKNPDNQMITELYQTISGCKAGFLENFLHYAFVAKNDITIQQQKAYDPLEPILCPYCGAMIQRGLMSNHIFTAHSGQTAYSKKNKSAPKKSKKSKKAKSVKKSKKSKSAPKKTKKSKSKAKKAKSAKKAKKSKSKSKKRSTPKKAKKNKSKSKKRSAPKKVKKSKSKSKKRSVPKKAKKSKSKSKKRSAPKKSKKSKSKSKKQSGGKPARGPGAFMKKMADRKKKPSPLRNEIKPELGSVAKPVKRIKLIVKSEPTSETSEWEF